MSDLTENRYADAPTSSPMQGPSGGAAPSDGSAPAGDRSGMIFMIVLSVLEIGGSIWIVNAVKAHGGTDFRAYLMSMLAPLVGSIIYFVKTRDLSRASIVIMVFNLLGAGVALIGGHDSRLMLYKDAAMSAVIGLIFAGSLLFGRPVTMYFGERFMGTTPERREWFQGLWRYRQFRTCQRLICVMWAVLMLLEAGSKAWVIHTTSFANAFAWTQVLPIAATVVGIVGTMLIVRQSMVSVRHERERREAGQAAQPA